MPHRLVGLPLCWSHLWMGITLMPAWSPGLWRKPVGNSPGLACNIRSINVTWGCDHPASYVTFISNHTLTHLFTAAQWSSSCPFQSLSRNLAHWFVSLLKQAPDAQAFLWAPIKLYLHPWDYDDLNSHQFVWPSQILWDSILWIPNIWLFSRYDC